eukprot:24684_5
MQGKPESLNGALIEPGSLKGVLIRPENLNNRVVIEPSSFNRASIETLLRRYQGSFDLYEEGSIEALSRLCGSVKALLLLV